MNIALSEITEFIDALLDKENVPDSPNALNGLQLASPGHVTKLGAAVDAGEPTLQMAAEAGVDLLLVHHGLFWQGLKPVTGALYRKLALAVKANMAIYSAHLPLDVHPSLGNNVLLAKALGLDKTQPFYYEKGKPLGLKGVMVMEVDELMGRVEQAVGQRAQLIAGGPEETRVVGIVTGGAGGGIEKAAAEGVDTFITGEAPHWAAIMAEELGVNMILGGHYSTETFGVKALAEHLSAKFGLPWEFLDYPTGL
jgi:dinuclear metal center YbgI/SA1388 family protein